MEAIAKSIEFGGILICNVSPAVPPVQLNTACAVNVAEPATGAG